jgi:epoxyqueuosine reductase
MVGDWLFGCDLCQNVCPWNISFAHASDDKEFAPCLELRGAEPDSFVEIEPEAFRTRYDSTPLERPGHAGMRRNALAVLANRQW